MSESVSVTAPPPAPPGVAPVDPSAAVPLPPASPAGPPLNAAALLSDLTPHYMPQGATPTPDAVEQLAQGVKAVGSWFSGMFGQFDGQASEGATPPPPAAPPSAGSPQGGNMGLKLSQKDKLTLATITPPQTKTNPVSPTHGAHCLVIDVSFSMEMGATVTNDDGDKVDHGFTVLDIAKHAMCTYVTSLGDEDWVSVACYASEAKMVRTWTQCNADGKEALFTAIKSLKEEGSTNLTAGIATGMGAFGALPPAVAANPSDYALLLAVATDGQPSSGTDPPGGMSYADFVQKEAAGVAQKHGNAAIPQVVAIGLGNDLDSKLLYSFSDTFLHIPDPGSVGPFMVNLLAATRCTARVDTTMPDGTAATAVANRAVLTLSPASAVAAVPGFKSTVGPNGQVIVPLGSLVYDQLRHVLIITTSHFVTVQAIVTIEGSIAAKCAGPSAPLVADFDAQVERTAAVCALQLHEQRLTTLAPKDDVAARLAREGARIGDVTISLVWNDEADLDLHVIVPSGEEISYNNKKSKCGGELDVDMNASPPFSKEPVENVYSGDAEKGIEAPKGKYIVIVENYGYHGEGAQPRNVDFKVQVRMNGDEVTNYTGTCVRAKERVKVVEFEYTGKKTGGASDKLSAKLQDNRRKSDAEKALMESVDAELLPKAMTLISDGPLKTTLTAEALLAIQTAKFKTWGKHYLVTLPQMLRAERRSNFRDQALQDFGKDERGQEAFFEELSGEAEQAFAELEPPKPSGLERLARQAAAAARPPPRVMETMPDEFMRGGGCFAPEALLTCVAADGSVRAVPIAAVTAGMRVRTASGGTAMVRCVVESPCEGGMVALTALPSGLQLTEWHPILHSASSQWRFPLMVGQRVIRRCPSVLNLVLDREHVAMV
eukprot:CAMPEP_0174714686 /NCGR_PEP_ID=MMETSP1094-20130205/18656_1 /TAXON_ID=156173 /ORGANISM="Chrysochromulina brevifilum, Strain UTEX LB 985" /LENGTH=885 /DNA_ID=CAMNT_0015914089 /DNA_START=113 /DNA_END=2767 /DNA_ORIENTATION=+